MKKGVTIVCLALSALLILDSFQVWHALAMFYLTGEIPGTNRSISPDTMMGIFALIGGFVIARIGNRAVIAAFDRISFKRRSQQHA